MVDGNAAQVPISLPLGAEPHTLVFRADGYEPMVKTLDGTKSRTLVLGMRRTPEPAPAVPPVPRGADAATKPAAKSRAKSRDAKGGKRGHATDLFLDI